jgi:hypothetical protein
MVRVVAVSIALLTLPFAAEAQKAKKAVNNQAVQELKAAHQLLAAANHDYNGHRAKAAGEVHKAIRELGHQHDGTIRPAKGGGSKEEQALSDAQLLQAQKGLASTLSHLNSRHPRAHTNVQAAINEINLALASRQKK